MTGPPEHSEDDRTTTADRVPLPLPDQLPPRQHVESEIVDRISLTRRQSHTIAPPRKWRKTGLSEIVCPECRAKIPSIQDGFWHLQTAHNQGKGVDLEEWGRELRAELDEFIDASQGRRGYVEDVGGRGVEHLTRLLLWLIALIAVVGIVFIIANLHH